MFDLSPRVENDRFASPFKLQTWELMAEDMVYCENYGDVILQGLVSTAYKSAAYLWTITGSLRRIQVYEIEFGQSSLPSSTDCQVQWDVSRFTLTAIMTAVTVAANLLDLADITVASGVFANAAGGELTYAAAGAGLNLKNWGINQRGSYRWRALDDGDNLYIPAVTQSGIGVRVLSSNYTGSAVGTVSWIER